MAYMSHGKGPYPNKTGEFCGNYLPGSFPIRLLHQTQEEADQHQREWLAHMRIGRPSNCAAGSSGEMAAKGWVGLYLKEDCNLHDWEVPVDTDELSENYVSSAIAKVEGQE